MTKVTTFRNLPTFLDRESFLTPFDKLFDTMFETNFPEFVDTVGVKPFSGTAYPKVNVYEYDDKVGIVAEIPGLDKKDLDVEVEEGVLTISGKKHAIEEGHAYEYDGGKKKKFVAEIETEKAAKKEDLVDKPAEE